MEAVPVSATSPLVVHLVALVDDDASIRRSVGNLLLSEGFRVAAFASAEAFLASSTRGVAACLVLDIHLGGMSGLDLLERLEAEERARTVILTARADDKIRDRARAAGVSVVLNKPVEADALLAAGRAVVQSG